jgi:hypothetical protein
MAIAIGMAGAVAVALAARVVCSGYVFACVSAV